MQTKQGFTKKKTIARIFGVIALSVAVLLSVAPSGLLLLADEGMPIDSVEDFQSITPDVTAVYLTDDVDMQKISPNLTGVSVNGKGHMLYNLSAPLFDEITDGQSVRNLGLSGALDDIGDSCGLLARFMSGGAVSACFSVGTISYQNENGVVGGLIGQMSGGTVTESFSCVDIGYPEDEAVQNIQAAYIGGFIGKMSGGSVSDCYSTGRIAQTKAYNAGLLWSDGDGNVQNTYTACQLQTVSLKSKPSGAASTDKHNYYDAQLGVLRESMDDACALKTTSLMTSASLSDAFLITSTTYPVLKTFYDNTWSASALDAVRVSTAAAALSDADASVRQEPGSDGFYARADYLTQDVYVDRTHDEGFTWTLSDTSGLCKQYDTVPTTVLSQLQQTTTGRTSDFLRSRLVFGGAVETLPKSVKMTVACGGFTRSWVLTSCGQNPYFSGGNGKQENPFSVCSQEELSNIRYYALLGVADYRLDDSVILENFDPIDRFRGTFDGNAANKNAPFLSGSIKDSGEVVALFRSLEPSSTVQNLSMKHIAVSSSGKTAACLAGSASGATVSDVYISGTNTVYGKTVGALLASATDTTIQNCLVSADVQATAVGGGLVGTMSGGLMDSCGMTGIVSGTGTLGGLVGETTSAGTIRNSYSTAPVIETADDPTVYAAGLVGNNTFTIANSYTAAMVIAVNNATTAPLACGSGTIIGCLFDRNYVENTNGGNTNGGMSTDALTAGSAPPSWETLSGWTYQQGRYPQRSCFADSTDAVKQLSTVSAFPVFYQNYWQDGKAVDMTTGSFESGVMNTVGAYALYSDPVTVKDSTRFEVDRSNKDKLTNRRVVLQLTDENGNLHISASTYDGFVNVTYEIVSGDSGAQGVNADLAFRYDDQVITLRSKSGEPAKTIYGISKGVTLETNISLPHGYTSAVCVTCGGSPVVSPELSVIAEQDIVITVTVYSQEPAWGVYRESI